MFSLKQVARTIPYICKIIEFINKILIHEWFINVEQQFINFTLLKYLQTLITFL